MNSKNIPEKMNQERLVWQLTNRYNNVRQKFKKTPHNKRDGHQEYIIIKNKQ